jgi:hypothetical protein
MTRQVFDLAAARPETRANVLEPARRDAMAGYLARA